MYEHSLLHFSLSAKDMYLEDPSLISCGQPCVNLSRLKVLVKSCFPKPYLALRTYRRVGVGLASCPGLYERERENRGKVGKLKERRKGKIRT